MLRSIIKIILAIVAIGVTLTLLAVASLAVWVMTGPKSISKLVPYIETSINHEDAPYRIAISDAVFFWENWSEPVDFRLRGVQILTPENEPLLKLPEVSVGLDMDPLLQMQIVPKFLVLRSPSLRVFVGEDDTYYLGFGDEDEQRIPLALLMTGLESSPEEEPADDSQPATGEEEEPTSLVGSIEYIQIRHARLTVGQPGEEPLLDAPDANLRVWRRKRSIWADLDVILQEGERVSAFDGQIRLANRRDMISGKIELQNISPSLMGKVFPDQPYWDIVNIPFSGWADVIIDNTGKLALVDFSIEGGEGQFTLLDHFAEPLTITQSKLEGQIREDGRQLMVKQAIVHFGDASLNVNGLLKKDEAGWLYDLAAVAENMPVNDLYKYWPKSLAPTPYKWVTTHIREGTVPKAELRVKLTKEQLGQPFPEEAFHAAIQTKGATVDYLDGHPKVQGVDGVVTFTGKSMTITSEKGHMLSGTQLKKAKLVIPDLRANQPSMQISIAVAAPAKDVVQYVSIPKLNYAQPLALNADAITGNAEGTMSFSFLLPSSKPGASKDLGLKFDITAQLKEVAQDGFMGNMNLSDVNGELKIVPDEVTYNGNMALDKVPLQVALTHFFQPQAHQTEYRATGVLSVDQLQVFGLPQIPQVIGNIGVAVDVKRNEGVSSITGQVDLTQAQGQVEEIGLYKKAGDPAFIRFSADMGGGALALKAFELKGNEVYVSGSAAIRDNMQSIEQIRFDRVEFNDNNLALDIEKIEGGYKVRAKGPSLDLKPYFKERKTGQERSFVQLPFILDVHGEFDWVVVGKERELRQVNARFICNPHWCPNAHMRGITGQDSMFTFDIAPKDDGNRKVDFVAHNAGGFLKAVDVYDNMVGGQLSVRGAFNDQVAGRPFKGKLEISENKIVNAPVLAKLASLMSLSGLANAMRGEGIVFSYIEGDIELSDTAFIMRKGKAVGPSLGLTVEESIINRITDEVNIHGTIVPSYTLNSVLGNIPLVGKALSGGDGQGVFAATYEVKGIYPDQTKVSVNPLTMLAPGFLRNLVSGHKKAETPPPAVTTEPVQAQPQAVPAPTPTSTPTQ